MLTKNCTLCGTKFPKDYRTSLRRWNEVVKFCSQACKKASQKGINPNTGYSFEKGHIPPHKGKWSYSKTCFICQSSFRTGKDSRLRSCPDCRDQSFREHLLQNKRSPLEQSLYSDLDNLGFIPQYRVSANPQNYWLDFARPSDQLYIEIDGQSHKPDRDFRKIQYLTSLGWRGCHIREKRKAATPEYVLDNLHFWINHIQKPISLYIPITHRKSIS